MAVSLNQSATAGSSGSNPAPSLTFAANDIILVWVELDSPGASNTSVTGVTSSHLTFSLAGKVQDTSSVVRSALELWYAIASAGQASESISVATTGSEASAAIAQAWSGVDNSSPFDVAVSFASNYTGSSGSTAPTVTTTTANAMVVAASGNIFVIPSVGSGFTDAGSKNQAGSNNAAAIRSQYQLNAAAGAVTCAFGSTHPRWSSGSLALKEAPPVVASAQPVICICH